MVGVWLVTTVLSLWLREPKHGLDETIWSFPEWISGGDYLRRLRTRHSLRVCGAMVARLTSIVIRYQKVAVSNTVTLIFFSFPHRLEWRRYSKSEGQGPTFESESYFHHSLLTPFVSVICPQLHRGRRMATADQITVFIKRQRDLLVRERDAEAEQSALLLTNCGPKLLEQKGLAILGLGIASINIGLGGKR